MPKHHKISFCFGESLKFNKKGSNYLTEITSWAYFPRQELQYNLTLSMPFIPLILHLS